MFTSATSIWTQESRAFGLLSILPGPAVIASYCRTESSYSVAALCNRQADHADDRQLSSPCDATVLIFGVVLTPSLIFGTTSLISWRPGAN